MSFWHRWMESILLSLFGSYLELQTKTYNIKTEKIHMVLRALVHDFLIEIWRAKQR